MFIQCYLVPLALVRTSKLTSLLAVEKMDVPRFQSCKLRNACDSLLNIRTPARFRGVSSFIHLGMFNNVLQCRILDEVSLRAQYRIMLTERLS